MLQLEIGLRFPERTSLLFELLVADAQFLRAGLQLFSLLLSFLQQFFQTLTILGGAHRDCDRLGDTREQLALVRIGGAKKAQFHDGVHHAVDARGGHQQLVGRALTDTGGNRQIPGRDVAHAKRALVFGRLTHQAVAGTNAVHRNTRRNRVACETPILSGFGNVHGANLRLHEPRQKPEQIVAQSVERLVALHLLAQAHLAPPDPAFRFSSPEIARRDQGGSGNQNQQYSRSAQGYRQRYRRGMLRFPRTLRNQLPLARLHLGYRGADAIHVGLASVRAHNGERCIGLAPSTRTDGGFQFRHLEICQGFERIESPALVGPVAEQRAQRLDLVRQRIPRLRVGRQIALLARE